MAELPVKQLLLPLSKLFFPPHSKKENFWSTLKMENSAGLSISVDFPAPQCMHIHELSCKTIPLTTNPKQLPHRIIATLDSGLGAIKNGIFLPIFAILVCTKTSFIYKLLNLSLTFTLPPSLVRYPSFDPNWKKSSCRILIKKVKTCFLFFLFYNNFFCIKKNYIYKLQREYQWGRT